MHYEVKLPKSVSGSELVSAFEKAAAALGWKVEETVREYAVSKGSVHVEPKAIDLEFRTRGFLARVAEISFIEPKREYSKCSLSSYCYDLFVAPLSGKEVEDLVSKFYEKLEETQPQPAA